ncbi:MAG: hypothetical protein ACFFB0_08590 [Promethearchaeota archaeon]
MSFDSQSLELTSQIGKYIKKTINLLRNMLDILSRFKNNYNKKFNITKFAQYLQVSSTDINELISLIVEYQNMFHTIFKDYKLLRKREGNQLYMIVQKQIKEPIIIKFTSTQIKVLNDIYYWFKVVHKGKGFNILQSSPLTQKLNILLETHPLLFIIAQNNLVYLSDIGQKIGDMLISYNKSNKAISEFIIENYIVRVEANGGT